MVADALVPYVAESSAATIPILCQTDVIVSHGRKNQQTAM